MKYSTIHQKMNEIFNRIPIFGTKKETWNENKYLGNCEKGAEMFWLLIFSICQKLEFFSLKYI